MRNIQSLTYFKFTCTPREQFTVSLKPEGPAASAGEAAAVAAGQNYAEIQDNLAKAIQKQEKM